MSDKRRRVRRRRSGGDSLIDFSQMNRRMLGRAVVVMVVVVALALVAKLTLEAIDPAVVVYKHDVTKECLNIKYFDRNSGEEAWMGCDFKTDVWYEQVDVEYVPKLPN